MDDNLFNALLMIGYGRRRVVRNFALTWTRAVRETDIDTTNFDAVQFAAILPTLDRQPEPSLMWSLA